VTLFLTILRYSSTDSLLLVSGKPGDKLSVGLYLRIAKTKVGNVLSLCNRYLELQMQYERALNSIEKVVQPDRRVNPERVELKGRMVNEHGLISGCGNCPLFTVI
jgi:hypothetical protein